jgi:hypothetical protein
MPCEHPGSCRLNRTEAIIIGYTADMTRNAGWAAALHVYRIALEASSDTVRQAAA